ncbi:sensor histidine kinase [Alloalcanivorax mobilis]|uniref:sensor histidine kinase n=1 Tax=Alloalcanivorax mobilis TaxID=2019569 RepID=UPI000B5B2EC7|nr:ATP-binding protein [Alloalcanivorax mobilis]ASK36169.1 PAS domain-containing sensor histidine kinase [Alcanivorax sp. N3-2A]|tara:strand:- start:33559 stop:35079 length:1521 start_codon:yes stop_codon:yes gene_type:complete
MDGFDVLNFSILSGPFEQLGSQGLFLISSTLILLVIIFFLYKTYRASMNVEARLAEFSSFTGNAFGRKLRLIEVNADEYKLNKSMLGPLARIIEEYCVITTDARGVITFANDRFLALSQFRFADLIGQHESINHPLDHQELEPHFMRGEHARRGVWSGDVCGRTQNNQVYWVNMFIFPLSYISDEDDGYIYFGTDITQIKAHNNALQQAVRDKDQKITQVESLLLHSEKMASLGTISAGIAHEINNPIAFLSANLRRSEQYLGGLASVVRGLRRRIRPERFEQFLKAEPDVRIDMKALEFILRDYPALVSETAEGIDRIKKIISDLKHFSRDKNEDFAFVDVARCVEVALNLAKHELNNRVTIDNRVKDGGPRVKGSESQLAQVFMNLLVNAAQAIQGRGEITLDAEREEHFYRISVSDSGAGIEADKLAQIFEPFFTTKPIGKGTGLGLSISQDIIKRHGGTLTASSVPGQGTTFDIRLPLAPATTADPQPDHQDSASLMGDHHE